MVIKIDSNHPIFKSAKYKKDIVPFNLIEVVKTSAKLLLSDERSYIICSMLFPSVPTWVWTVDNIGDSELKELCDYFYDYFNTDNRAYYVAKPDVASSIAEKYIKEKNAAVHRIHMESFECPTLIPSKNTSVIIEKAAIDDLEMIAEFSRNFAYECFGRQMPYEDSLKEAENFINNPKSFVIRENGKAISMAKSARETEKHIAINGVYTLSEYRGRGFAAALVAHICKLIITEGKIPLLYTDLANPSSNKAYTNVGFIPRGRVDEIKLEWGEEHGK